MPHAAVVRLGRHRKQTVAVRARVTDHSPQRLAVEREIVRDGRVTSNSAIAPRGLTQPVDRVVLIRGQEQLAAVPVEVLQQQDRRCRTRGPDHLVVVAGVEVVEHRATRFVDLLHRSRRGRVMRVWIAAQVLQGVRVRGVDQLPRRVCSAGEIRVDIAVVQLREVNVTQREQFLNRGRHGPSRTG